MSIYATAVVAQSLADLRDDYRSLREKFYHQVTALKFVIPGVQLSSEQVPSTFDEELFIDSVFIPSAEKAKKLIILTSGVHGVEASVGSFQQRMFMSGFLNRITPAIDRTHTATLVIHIVNPYGFKYGRRVNENNVDLNRNCFDYRAHPFPGPAIANPEYEKNQRLLESPMTPTSLAIRGLFKRQSIREALSGQYESPHGIYFGGQRLEPECLIVQKLIENYAYGIESIAHIDFHSGLGPKGLTQIMTNAPTIQMMTAYERELKVLRETMFPKERCQGSCEVQEFTSANFLTNGDMTQYLHSRYPEKRKSGLVIAVTSEIGTYSPLTTLPAIVNENYCHWHPGDCNPAAMSKMRNDLISAFVPIDDQWTTRLEQNTLHNCNALLKFSEL